MSQIVNAKLGSADVIARCIERALDRFYPTSLVHLVRLSSLLVDWVAAHTIATVDAEGQMQAPSADRPQNIA